MANKELTNEEILDAIAEMSVLKFSEFIKQFEERFGVSAAAPVVVGAVAQPSGDSGGTQESEVEEKDQFDVVLTSFGDKKVQVIKEVRALVNLTVTEAKSLVESAPATILEKVSKAEAEKAKAALEAAGATVELK